MIIRSFVLASLGLSGVAHAACEPVASADLARLEVAAELALESLDSAKLQQLGSDVAEVLPCLSDTVQPPTAARVHRLLGFAAYVGGRLDEAEAHFVAARVAEPSYEIPPVVLVEGHPLRKLFESSSAEAPVVRELPAPAEGELRVDGIATRSLPTGRPAVVQHVDASGRPTVTALTTPGQPPPSYGEASDAPVSDDAPRLQGDLLLSTVVFDAPPDDIGTLFYGGLSAGLAVPVAGPVVVAARVGAAWTPLRDEWNVDHSLPLVWAPHAGLGVGFAIDADGGPQLTPGLQAVFTAAEGEGLLPGAAAVLDARVAAGPIAVAADLRVGWAGAPLVGVGVGVGF